MLLSIFFVSFIQSLRRTMKNIVKHAWFSVIEILVAILIFTFWLVAVYMVIASSLRLNDYNKHFIIASNLAREEIELFKNIRDANYSIIHKWTQINPKGSYSSPANDFFLPGKYYAIENDYSPSATFGVKVKKLNNFGEWVSMLSTKMQQYRLCLDSEKRYTYDCASGKKTNFYRYLKVEPLVYMSWATEVTEADALRVTATVVWYQRGYNQTDISTIVTDWKRL